MTDFDILAEAVPFEIVYHNEWTEPLQGNKLLRKGAKLTCVGVSQTLDGSLLYMVRPVRSIVELPERWFAVPDVLHRAHKPDLQMVPEQDDEEEEHERCPSCLDGAPEPWGCSDCQNTGYVDGYVPPPQVFDQDDDVLEEIAEQAVTSHLFGRF